MPLTKTERRAKSCNILSSSQSTYSINLVFAFSSTCRQSGYSKVCEMATF